MARVPLPPSDTQLVDDSRRAAGDWYDWFRSVDRTINTSNLVNAANDVAAAAAGVAVGEIYRNGSVLQVRVS